MMSEHVTQGMIDCWRVNYDLDKTPHDLYAFWGCEAPSGAVLALKAACDEIQSLRKDAERYRKVRDRTKTKLRIWLQNDFDGSCTGPFYGEHLDAALDALPGVEDAIL